MSSTLGAELRPWWSVSNDGHLFSIVIRHVIESGAVEEGKRLLDYRFMEAPVHENGVWQVVQILNTLLAFFARHRTHKAAEQTSSILQ